MGTEIIPSNNGGCPEPASPGVTDSKTMITLTFTAHLHAPTELCPALSLQKYFHHFGDSLGDASLLSSRRWPHSNSFPVSPPLSLPWIGSVVEWPNLVCLGPLEPDALSPLHPGYAEDPLGTGVGEGCTEQEHEKDFKFKFRIP